MIKEDDAAIIDEGLAGLPELLSSKGFTFVQRKGYKAFWHLGVKWCQFNDGNVPIKIRFPDTIGETKTWKLFARFDHSEPPSRPWSQPERYQYKKAQWMMGGDDVWGVTYEDIKEWAGQASSKQVTESIATELEHSFRYMVRHYE